MGFPIKLSVHVYHSGIDLSPSDYLQKKFDFRIVEINLKKHMEMVIKMEPRDATIKSDSMILKVIKEFESRTDNYKGMFVFYESRGCGFVKDHYRFETSNYELSKEDFGQIIYDYIDSLKKEMSISTETLNQINEAFAQFGYQLPKVINSSSPRLSIFSKNDPNSSQAPLPEKIDTEEVSLN